VQITYTVQLPARKRLSKGLSVGSIGKHLGVLVKTG
jgi:hypothetical protein